MTIKQARKLDLFERRGYLDYIISELVNLEEKKEETVEPLLQEIDQVVDEIIKISVNLCMENIIDDISNLVTEKVSTNIKVDMDDLKIQVQELQEQNKILIDLMQQQQKVSLLSRFKQLFKG